MCPSDVVVTTTLAESGTQEEAKNEAITDVGFVASHPFAGVVPAWSEEGVYGLGDLVQEGGIVYRSQAAGNEENEPKADTDFVHWAPQPTASYLLQNDAFTTPEQVGTLRTRYQIVGVPQDPKSYVYPYAAGTAYRRGECVAEEGVGYEALKATTGETPSSHPLAWKPIGQAILLGV